MTTDLNEIKAYVKEEWHKVQEELENSLLSDIELLNSTNKKILSCTGKQLRPLLTILIARLCSKTKSTTEDTIRFAVAAELLHNATLLHDDVADNSFFRRGVATTMSLLGGRASVLIGDFWLVQAVDSILKSEKRSNEVIQLYAQTLKDLAEGEMLQLQKIKDWDTTEDDYLKIIYCKTASLFVSSVLSGAISVDADERKREAVKIFALNIGMAFQIQDDILDYSGDPSNIGKPVINDIKDGKITLPLLMALSNTASASEKQNVLDRIKALSLSSNTTEKLPEAELEDLHRFVIQNKGIESAKESLSLYIKKAVDALSSFDESREKEYLCALARFTEERDK